MAWTFDPKSLDDLPGKVPTADGDINEYLNPEIADKAKDHVVFVNGMANKGEDHKRSALALSLVRFAKVTGIYNKEEGLFWDLVQCLGDKNQFNGFSLSAKNKVIWNNGVFEPQKVTIMRKAMTRNKAQVALFDTLLKRGPCEIHAHSQGNLILSNVLQALIAIKGDKALAGYKVYSYGSPTCNWPEGLVRAEMAYTFDPVSWLGGLDLSFTTSKLGMPSGSMNPITHGFMFYLQDDPAFVINRFRTGMWGMTFNMDEKGLAECLVAMRDNRRRVTNIFQYLKDHNWSDSDDIAMEYIKLVRRNRGLELFLQTTPELKKLLIELLDAGWTTSEQYEAIDFIKKL